MHRELLLATVRGGGSFSPPLEDEMFHGAKAYHNAVVDWTNQEAKALPLNSEEFDTDGYHSGTTNNNRMTVPAGFAGYYWCHASAYISAEPSQDAPLYILKNYPGTGDFNPYTIRGAQVTPYTAQPADVGGVAQSSCLVFLAGGDWVEAWLYVDNGATPKTFPVGSATDPGLQMSLAIARIGT